MILTFVNLKTLFICSLGFSVTLVIILITKAKENNFIEIPELNTLPLEPNCEKLYNITVSDDEMKNAENWIYADNRMTDKQFSDKIKNNCSLVFKNFKYIQTNDREEEQFSIAFSILTFKALTQVERLLRTIYRPWNYYCIHVDLKSDSYFFNGIEQLTTCLNDKYGNIINTKNRVNVSWGTMSVLTADLNCMKELYDRYKNWKYLINLTGQEFPLKTNRELVYILKSYDGASNVGGTYKLRREHRIPTNKMPFPLTWYKGSVHISVNWHFINFIFTSTKAAVMLNMLKDRLIPDEQFFNTLNYNSNLRIPGSFIGDIDDYGQPGDQNQLLTRVKRWAYENEICLSGKTNHEICILGIADLPNLVRAKHLFANKFHEEFQPAALRCLETWLYGKVRKETLSGEMDINLTYYKSMIFVKNQFRP